VIFSTPAASSDENPANLPAEQATNIELRINLKP
jgi:hypothetical protein